MTNMEHFWSHVINIAHFSSHTTEHTTNTATVLRFICIRTALSAAFIDASGFIGDIKRLCLPRFDGYLSVSDDLESPLCLILRPVVNPPMQKLYIN